ncbi:MAG: N-acetylgalactosamine-N,N'-diacetylbacillosaminyl-diphospho-undecaprenol 4-alpha-N-acetylgalactosaminyltransferase [Alphaproteobacteria bacterium MarineAlpha5_Bin6]|nr:MAG: N-acetylgalactosamine-N,N'-diacetylbacillosaminyl-diphospho-undecaprenol 4-alpha-N-acetylgalactosaminyltransferase [Alphaproteobacteria bacterium MarineAlpha5_Bin6]|tara:strand:- start:1002 stop:2114 length:1113 start_codon:yes stop_codon:yes gene_type:complete
MKTIKKKIAIILPNLNNGGAERSHVYIANEWQKLGFSVTFILFEEKGSLINLLEQDITIINLNIKKIRKAFFPLIKLFFKKKFDFIVAPMWPITIISTFAWLLSFKRGKLYLVDHNPIIKLWADDFKINWFVIKISIRLVYNLVNGVVSVSSGIKDNINSIVKINQKKIRVIYNPIKYNADILIKDSQIKTKLFGESKLNIVSTGSLKKSKDYGTLINAIDLLIKRKNNLKLFILGEGEERLKLEKLIQEKKLHKNIKLVGHVHNPMEYLFNGDLYVNTSLYDGLPLSLIEALLSGIPIISTNCESGPREILNNGKYGKLIPINDYKSLSDEIEKFIESKNYISTAPKNINKIYNPYNISKEYLDFFNIR